MKELAVKTVQLNKTYKKHQVLKQINLNIERGSIYGLIGRNGAGKTTLMKLITGLAQKTEGEIFLFGENVTENRRNHMRLGALIENPGVYPNMTAFENMRLQATAMGVYQKDQIIRLLKQVDLAETGNKKVKNFSMGMKQRLGIGLALIGSPDMLILDEPINGLDPQGIIEVRELIIRLCKEQGMTILLSSHILDELSKVATHYGIINEGNLILELTREELNEKCAEKIEIVTKDIAQTGVILDQMNISNYTIVDSQTIQVFDCVEQSAQINKELINKGISVQSIQVKADSLEEFFLKITQEKQEGK